MKLRHLGPEDRPEKIDMIQVHIQEVGLSGDSKDKGPDGVHIVMTNILGQDITIGFCFECARFLRESLNAMAIQYPGTLS